MTTSRYILAIQLWWVGQSIIIPFKYLNERVWLKVSSWKNNFSHQHTRRFYSKQWFKLFLLFQLVYFSSPLGFARNYLCLCLGFSGNKCKMRKKIIEKIGLHWGYQMREGSWVLGIWRTLIRPYWLNNCGESLINRFQVLKDKYFKEGCLLDAKLEPNPSFIWRSLWSTFDIVK